MQSLTKICFVSMQVVFTNMEMCGLSLSIHYFLVLMLVFVLL